MRLEWDEVSERFYETGTDRGVLYLSSKSGTYDEAYPWNGLTAVSDSPSGAEVSPIYADNKKYINLMSAEEYGCTIEAYTYPPEFAECDGSAELGDGVTIGQQTRKPFGFSYRTILGNDIERENYAYKIHLVYGCYAAPTERSYTTINESPEAITMSWEVSTIPVDVEGFEPTATVVIDSSKVSEEDLIRLEALLYGDDKTKPRLPMPDDILNVVKFYLKSLLTKSGDHIVTSNGDRIILSVLKEEYK